jgi:NAD(P)-dependent dehydrogenase (short-subunit alcohol dehydrogenase family)
MPSYVVTGASRGIGLEFVRQLVRLHYRRKLKVLKNAEQSASPENTVFALVRNVSTALAVPSSPLKNGLANVHVLEADVTDHKALKVRKSQSIELEIAPDKASRQRQQRLQR